MLKGKIAMMENLELCSLGCRCHRNAGGRRRWAAGVLLGVALSAAFLASACSSKPADKEKEQERLVTVDVAPVVSGTIQLKITANGVLYPLQQAAIIPKISAPVAKFYVERGSPVHAGQLLAELENHDLAGAAAEARGAYEQAQATYQSTVQGALPEEIQKAELDAKAAKEAMDAVQKVYESRQALFKEGAISGKEVDDSLVSLTQARNQYQIAQKHLQSLQSFGREQELKAATGQLAAAKGKYESAEAQLSYTKIVSPIDGVVTDRPIYPGEMASNSAPFLTVMDLSQVIARAHIAQQEAAVLKVGNPATISAPGQAGDLPGKLTVVSPALDPNSTTVEIWVQAANPGGKLKPGSSVRVQVVAQTVPDAMRIPAAAVLTSPSGATSVMVVDSENKPHKKHVTVGIRDGNDVQITEGLQSGDRVVTVGAFELDKEDEDVLAKTKVQIQTAPAPEEEDAEK